MKKAFLLMVVSGLLVTLGFAQTPDADSNAAQANVKGCLGGSDGNYTVAEDGTHQVFKITTSSVDLKSYLGHDVTLIGHKASGAASSGATDNSFAVTELNMISDHCAAAAVAPVATANPSSETVIPPAAAATAPAATTSSPSPDTASTPTADATPPAATASPSSETVSPPTASVTAPAATASTPTALAATASPSSETVSAPAGDATTPTATVSPSSTVSAPAADAAQPTGQSTRPPRAAAKTAGAAAPAATASPSSDTVVAAAADTTTSAATANTSETVSPPVAAATAPAVTHTSGSLFLLIFVAVLVVVLGTLVPVFGRWRKRKMLERTGTPNLSFMKEESSDRNKPAPRKAA
jgi:hypothetical protein